MKKLLFTCLFAFVFVLASAQTEEKEYIEIGKANKFEQDNLTKSGTAFGGYISIHGTYGELQGEPTLFSGGKIAAVINHRLAVGFTGTGIYSPQDYPSLGDDVILTGGYGGIFIEPIIMPQQVVHFSFPVSFNAGSVGFVDLHSHDHTFGEPPHHDFHFRDVIWVLEPAVNVEANVANFFRIAAEVNYRISTDYRLEDLTDENLNGLSAGLSLKFGFF